jgi:hypothetical protein
MTRRVKWRKSTGNFKSYQPESNAEQPSILRSLRILDICITRVYDSCECVCVIDAQHTKCLYLSVEFHLKKKKKISNDAADR